ncbi:hypothetical protein [Aggregatimonas sangjinii]|nr:hypothetical protein [Aggregatimonas sangjinii]
MQSKQEYDGFWKKLGCFLSVIFLLVFLVLFLYIVYFIFFDDKEWFNID